jgi:exodeoxyribonuclease VII large subunit
MEPAAISVSELTQRLKQILEDSPQFQGCWIKGEISNFKHHSSGHMYFSLKDDRSKIRCVMFAGYNRLVKFKPKDGDHVLVRGYLSVYERDGQVQLYIQEMQPDGVGSLYLAFEQLKEKLSKEGLFDPVNKKPLPLYPRVIGVITSPTGAVIRDILTTIKRRYPLVDILIVPVPVQGESASRSIARAITMMSERADADVLIVGRGGGSIEELWAFNEEVVARSIFQCRIPIISAVGHETDFTIADFVADVRAATPTAAAELAVPSLHELRERLNQLRTTLSRRMNQHVKNARQSLQRLSDSAQLRFPQRRVDTEREHLDRLYERLFRSCRFLLKTKQQDLHLQMEKLARHSPNALVERKNLQLKHLEQRLALTIQRHYRERLSQYQGILKQLDALSPLKVMGRGYGLIYREENGQLVRSVKDVELGDVLRLRIKDGILGAQVWEVKEDVEHEC